VIELSYRDVYERLDALGLLAPGDELVYGVPRGGLCAAAFCNRRVVEDPARADVILDDIIDTGRTRAALLERYPGKEFLALVDKTAGDPPGWYVFPWEKQADSVEPTEAVVRLLQYLGEDPQREGLRDTPARVVKALRELTAGYRLDPVSILGTHFEEESDGLVVVKDIPFDSLCEHHILPFHGTVSIGYVPAGRVVGLSKLPRVVECFARRLQVQERMTRQIADAIMDHPTLKPEGVAVVVRGRHSCMAMRGVQKAGEMVTSEMRGLLWEAEARAEFLRLAGL